MTRIVIFAKAPVPGRVKTRLIPALGAEGAADLAAAMLDATCREALAAGIGPIELCLDRDPGWSGAIPAGVEVTDQTGDDLGDRLWRAALRVGAPLIFIGTDCPALDRARLRAATDALAQYDAVLHPAEDGGYALLGLARIDRSLFEGIAWSTETVAAATLARIAALGWSVHVGETLHDIDEPADLPHVPPYLLSPEAAAR